LDCSIHDARIYSDTDGSTLDTFFVLKNDGSSLDAHPDNAVEIKRAIQHSLHHATLKTISRHTPRTAKAFKIPTTVDFSQDDSSGLTILEVTTADRPGLMARLGSVLSCYAVSIQGAKIQTLGEKVEDIFFLADASGGQLTDTALVNQLKSDLIAELDGLTSDPDTLPSERDI
jgi:[protein-PII] uridylyltransferase